MRNIAVVALLSVFLVEGVGAAESNVVQIKPDVAFNVTAKDDIAQLKKLAAGVGWEFEPNAKTTAGLKRIGIKRIRCINVDPLPGNFDEKGNYHVDIKKTSRIDAHLNTCREVGAIPHIIIAHGLHPDLRVKADDLETSDERILGLLETRRYGPNNWTKFRNCIKAYFEYILVTCGITGAQFEVANEPDIGGGMVPKPPWPPKGSRKAYEAYLNLYRNVAQAAVEFETEHPNLHVRLGGPALAWAFTFRYGAFNWSEQFLKDVNAQRIKLDFIGVHYYGNISPISGEKKGANYPPFSEMFGKLAEWRDKYTPKAEMCITEWGGSYRTNLNEESMLHNGGNVGASFAAAFLKQMLVEGVDEALYLVTTDLRQNNDGKWLSVWGWPSLFTNPHAVGTHPKAPYHVFEMVHRMAPKRVEASDPSGTLGTIASVSAEGRMTIMLWNHSHTIPEGGLGKETGKNEAMVLRIVGADKFFKSPSVQMKRQLVSKTVSNALYLYEQGEKLDGRAQLQTVDEAELRIADGLVEIAFLQPPSSVSFIELVRKQENR